MVDLFGRFIEGRVCFTAEHGFPELFLNRIKASDAVLHDLRLLNNGISASVSDTDLKKVMEAAAVSGMEIICGKRTGIRVFYEKYRKRIGIPVGMLISVIVFRVLCSVLWSVEISGLQSINPEEFNAYLSANGIKTGIFLVKVDCNEIERIIEKYDERIMRVAANLSGTKLYIDVKEREVPMKSAESGQYGNLVAIKDGEIVKADIFAGEQKVSVGDAVIKGDILAAGAVPLENGEVRLLQAQGRVIARTQTLLTCMTSKRIIAEKMIETGDLYSVGFFGICFPPQNNERIINQTLLSTNDSIYPIGIIRGRTTQRTVAQISLSAEGAMLITLNDIALTVYSSCVGKVIESVILSEADDGQAEVQARIICRENIAEMQSFESIDK